MTADNPDQAATRDSDRDPVNVLLVDELTENLLVMQSLLGELGENVVIARSGEEALHAVTQHDFAVILIAVNLPALEGHATAVLIRNHLRAAHTPLIFLSSSTDELQLTKGYSLGAVDYLRTPLNPVLLRAKVRVFIDLFQRAAQAQKEADERIALMQEQLAGLTKEADKRRNEFLAMLAHELRNPLAAIRGAVHVLCLSELSKDKISWARAIIDRQVNQLVRLIDDLLDVARIVQGRIRLVLETVDMSAIVDMAKELSVPLIVARRHNLSVTCPKGVLWVRGDAARLAQVLANLLNNAAKYTDSGGQIDLTVEREADQVVVRVRDNGMGIPAELKDTIFDLFTQANRSLDRSQGGLGIGLTLVRHIVEMHGGSVSVSSDGQNKGSVFSVRLPFAPKLPTAKIPILVVPPVSNVGLRVLVVDDNQDVADSLAIMLRQCGHEVALASDGPAALEAAKTFLPQVVLLDIGLPGLDGYEVARRMRTMPEVKAAFLVAITGYGQPEARLTANEAGFDVHLVKPVDPRTLNQLMAEIPAALSR